MCSAPRRTASSSTTAALPRATPTAASISSNWRRRSTQHALPDGSRRTGSPSSPTTRCTIRCFPNGCAVCEIEIDPDTGGLALTRYACVDDVGRCINPLIVHGQTHGAIAQGVGQALWEQFVVDPASGQPLTGSFMDYGMPRAHTAAVVQDRDRRGAVADQSARHQGRRRRRHHGAPAVIVSAHRRRAQALRRAQYRDAGDALSRLAGDREGGRRLTFPTRRLRIPSSPRSKAAAAAG